MIRQLFNKFAFIGYLCVVVTVAMAQTNPAVDSVVGSVPSQGKSLEICLNGEWNFQIDGLTNLVKVRVPGSYTGLRRVGAQEYYDIWDYPVKWEGKGGTYSRTVVLPTAMGGKRVSFWCGGVRHACTVKVNGVAVGGYEGSTVPFDLDITTALKSGTNEIEVHVAAGTLDSEDVNSNRRGFWGDVYLKAHGDVFITDDSFLTTAVARKQINHQVAVANEGKTAQQFSIHCQVTDRDGKVVKSFDGGKHTILPGINEVIVVSSDWEAPHLWSLDDPYLYHLQTVLNDEHGKEIARKDQRFGFREFSWKGCHLYLNGRLLYLRGAGDHSDGDLSGDTEYMRRWIKELKKEGVSFLRLHTMVKSAATFEVADEEGFLLEVEAPHHFILSSPERNCFNVEHLVKAYRNHPSVLVWSVSNELHWRGTPEPGYLIDLCHQLDPTRPAFASDFSGWSVLGDVLGHHYDTYQVFDEWAQFGPDKPMVWDEFGWIWPWDRPVASGSAGYEYASTDVSGAGLWRDSEEIRQGIEFFQNGKTFSNELHRINVWCPWDYSENFHRYQPVNNFNTLALSHDQIEGSPGIKPAFIKPGCSFINIWDPTLPAWEPNPGYDVIAPYLKSVRFWDREPRAVTFFGGDEVVRHSRIGYDDLRSCDEIACRVETPEGRLLSEVKIPISLQPGDTKEDVELRWQLPKVDTLTPVRLVRECRSQGQAGYRDVAEAKLFTTLTPALVSGLSGKKLAVSDTALGQWLAGRGFPIAEPSQADVWIVTEETPAVRNFVRRGGRVLQLAATSQADRTDTVLYEANGTPEKISNRTPISTDGVPSASGNFVWRAGNSAAGTNPVFVVEAFMGGTFIRYNPQASPGACLYVDLCGNGKAAHVLGSERLALSLTVGLDFKPTNINNKAELTHKELLPILRTGDREWFIASTNDAVVLESAKPNTAGTAINKDLHSVVWHRLRHAAPVLANAIEAETAPVVPDFSDVTAFGFCVAKDASTKVSLRVLALNAMGNIPASAHVPINGAPHRILAGLGQEDFTFWRGGSSASTLPVPIGGTNARVILQGNKDGDGAALEEMPLGSGVRVVSALNLRNNLDNEPAAQWLWRNILAYLADYKPAAAPQMTAVALGEKWEARLRELGLLADKLPANGIWNLPDAGQVVLDAGASEVLAGCRRNADALDQFVRKGGTVLVLGLHQNGVETFRSVTGRPLRLTEPFLGVRDVCIKAPVSWTRRTTPPVMVEAYDGILTHAAFEPNYDPLIAGLANADLNWRGQPMFDAGIEIEGMDPVMAKPDYSILISNWRVSLEQPANGLFREYIHAVHDLRQNSWFVNRDPVLLRINAGAGAWIFCQLDLTSGGERGQRVLAELLTNLRCSLGEPTRFAVTDFTFDPGPQRSQLQRFASMAAQVAPGRRQFYGTPQPLPNYLQNTFADGARMAAGALPTIQMLGDDFMLRFAPAVKLELRDKYAVTFGSKPLGNTRDTLKALGTVLSSNRWNTIFVSAGLEDLRLVDGKPAVGLDEFKSNLEGLLSKLGEAAGKIYWASIAIPPESRSQYDVSSAAAYNAAAEDICRKHNVYFINLNAIADQVRPGATKNSGQPFLQTELKEIGRRIASALTFLG